MDPKEEIYVNMDDLAERRAPGKTKTKPVRTNAVASEETGSGRPLKLAAACLGLMCVLLLTTVIAVSVQYDRDYNQLFRDLTNYTAEYQQLLLGYQSLTEERDQLQTSLNITGSEFKSMIKDVASCPDGWSKFGCSCYYLFPISNTWSENKQHCIKEGAELVIINSKEEMIFLNNLGSFEKFWIGLMSSNDGAWTWTDGSAPKTMHWKSGGSSYRGQMCAAFNRFAVGGFMSTLKSWSTEFCSNSLQFVCEREAQVLLLP